MDPNFYSQFNSVRYRHPLDASNAELGTDWHVDGPATLFQSAVQPGSTQQLVARQQSHGQAAYEG